MSRKPKNPREIWKCIQPILFKLYTREKTFLEYRTLFELLIAVILSAQTTDEAVNNVTKKLFSLYDTPAKLAYAPRTAIEKIIYPLGYYKSKSNYIQQTARMFVEDYKEIFPHTETALRRFKGVGRKTAVVVLSNGMGYNIGIPVDTHVIRFARRFGLSKGKNAERIEEDLCTIIDRKYWKKAGYAIKEYGRKEGKARGYNKEKDPLVIALHTYEQHNSKTM